MAVEGCSGFGDAVAVGFGSVGVVADGAALGSLVAVLVAVGAVVDCGCFGGGVLDSGVAFVECLLGGCVGLGLGPGVVCVSGVGAAAACGDGAGFVGVFGAAGGGWLGVVRVY